MALERFSDSGISINDYHAMESAVINVNLNEPVHEKTNNLGSDQVRHKPACTVTEDG